ncbi:hypothetical protein GCM10009841_19280 [Microlunatus panaciterrae]|uniref:Sec-independent protein translocase protein TatA n=1 Tax=Microlunatus panaciterrae TaxID=400768 RepID=A0ABS2RN93_9ACTN|nr:sec-independent protein translocase protein TatA [Microlunatus panaciterrae]
MTPLAMFGLGVPELLIILAVVLLLFGGSRLAGLGKSTGRALKEFKEETKGLTKEQNDQTVTDGRPAETRETRQVKGEPIDAEWVEGPQTKAQDPSTSDVRKDV